jgi:hypothetical protein
MGRNGWDYVQTDGDRRALIQHAITRQRARGTPGSIIDAIAVFGFAGVVVDDAPFIRYCDGAWRCNGRVLLDGGRPWPLYLVKLAPMADTDVLTETTERELAAICLAWQNARSRLKTIIVQPGPVLNSDIDPAVAATITHFGVGTSNAPGHPTALTDAFVRYVADTTITHVPPGLLGDVDDDGLITENDAEQLARFAVHLPVTNPVALAERGDVDENGMINIIDAELLEDYVNGLPHVLAPNIGLVMGGPGYDRYQFRCELRDDEANGLDVREFGLLNDAGDLLVRYTRSGAIAKRAGVSLRFDWTLNANAA